MAHKTTTIHSEVNNEFVMKIVEFKEFWQITSNCGGNEEIVFIYKKDGKITHTTGEK